MIENTQFGFYQPDNLLWEVFSLTYCILCQSLISTQAIIFFIPHGLVLNPLYISIVCQPHNRPNKTNRGHCVSTINHLAEGQRCYILTTRAEYMKQAWSSSTETDIFLLATKNRAVFNVTSRHVSRDDTLMYILIKLYGKSTWTFGYICSLLIIPGADNLSP